MRKVINFIAFQAAWFAAVLGAAHGMPWLGVVAVPLALALHLALSPVWRPELLLALVAAATGFVFDSIERALIRPLLPFRKQGCGVCQNNAAGFCGRLIQQLRQIHP